MLMEIKSGFCKPIEQVQIWSKILFLYNKFNWFFYKFFEKFHQILHITKFGENFN
jgi:hypothetical protein